LAILIVDFAIFCLKLGTFRANFKLKNRLKARFRKAAMVVSAVILYGLVFELLKLTLLVRISKHLPRILFFVGQILKAPPRKNPTGHAQFRPLPAPASLSYRGKSLAALFRFFSCRYIARSLYKEENAPIALSLPQRRGLKGQ